MNLYVKDITSWTLIGYRCPCRELNVLGFWHQLEPVIDYDRRIAYAVGKCVCGKAFKRLFRLTTGYRQRLFSWAGLFLAALPYVPVRLVRSVTYLVFWLEAKLPI